MTQQDILRLDLLIDLAADHIDFEDINKVLRTWAEIRAQLDVKLEDPDVWVHPVTITRKDNNE